MSTATDRYRLINNIVARVGIDGDIIGELARVESIINGIEQGKMMPPPMPSEPTEPTMSPQGEAPLMSGKYDEL